MAKKLGEGMIGKNLSDGLQYLRDVNEGKHAMGVPPIVEALAVETPAAEPAPSYIEALNRDVRADTRPDIKDLSR